MNYPQKQRSGHDLCGSAQDTAKPVSGQPGGQQPGEDDDDDDVPGDCGLIGGAAGVGQDRNPAREAKRQRDYLKDYFNNEGAVAWQDGRI